MKDYDYNFKRSFVTRHPFCREVYWPLRGAICYIVSQRFACWPFHGLHETQTFTLAKTRQDPDYLFPLALLSSSAITVLLATSVLGMAMARYRMPVSRSAMLYPVPDALLRSSHDPAIREVKWE